MVKSLGYFTYDLCFVPADLMPKLAKMVRREAAFFFSIALVNNSKRTLILYSQVPVEMRYLVVILQKFRTADHLVFYSRPSVLPLRFEKLQIKWLLNSVAFTLRNKFFYSPITQCDFLSPQYCLIKFA